MKNFRNQILLIALLLGAIIPLLISWFSGNLSIPHNDAWAYSRIAQNYADTGEIELLGWNRASLVGQFLPFGFLFASLTAQHLLVTLFSIILILSIYSLLSNYLTKSRAAVGSLIVAIWPGYALLSTSFMSDIPALATSFLALALAQRAITGNSFPLLCVSVLIAFWSFTIREQGLAAAVAIFIWGFLTWYKISKRKIFQLLTLLFGFLIAVTLFQLWRSSLPNSDPALFEFRQNALLIAANGFVRAYFEFALVIVPAAVLMGAKFRFTKFRFFLAFPIFFVGIFQFIYAGAEEFFLPNYLNITGSYSSVLPPTVNLFPELIWLGVIWSALALGVCTVFLFPAKLPTLNLLTVFSVLIFLGTFLQFTLEQGVFGRYLIPLSPFIFYLLLKDSGSDKPTKQRNLTKVPFVYALLSVTAISFGLMIHSFAFDRARWDIATHISENGINPMQIDAGLEWLGWHSPNGVVGEVRDGTEPKNYWEFNAIFENKPCFVLTQNRITNSEYADLTADWYLIDQISYKSFLAFGESRLYLYETFESSCQPKAKAI